MTTIPADVLKMIRHHEGVRQRPYLCPAHVWTVGVGRVLYQDQIRLPAVRVEGYTGMLRKDYPLRPEDNRAWTMEEVDALLAADLAFFARGVERQLTTRPSLGQFWACVSFAFNAGLGNLQRSTLRMRHNRADYEGAADEFMKWTRAAGRELPGLVKRRRDERALYLS